MSLLSSVANKRPCTCMLPALTSHSPLRPQSLSARHRALSAVRTSFEDAAPSRSGRSVPFLQHCWTRRQPTRRQQQCRPPSATRGRPPKAASEEDDEDLDELTPLVDFEDEQVGDDDDEEAAAEPDELENWTQKVVDWWDFASNEESLTAGMTVDDESAVPWASPMEKNFDYLAPNLDRIREQDRNFVGIVPIPERKMFDPTEPEPEPDPPFTNPDWNTWDYRAYVEKQIRKERERQEWNERRRSVGQYRNLVVDDTVDVRLQMPWDEQQPDWSHEEIWNLITLDGTAASPENIPLTVQDPKGRADVQEVGGKYTESTEEYLKRIGHMLDRPPTQEDLTDLGITQLAQDFEGLDQSSGTEDSGGEAIDTTAQPAATQPVQPPSPPPPPPPPPVPEVDEGGTEIMEEGWE